MNVENILKVADAIEGHTIAELGFNMAMFMAYGAYHDHTGHNCGTTACIGGWANALQAESLVAADFLTEGNARKFLGLDGGTSYDLFYAGNYPESMMEPDTDYFLGITDAQAVAVLRHLAATGEVDWTVGAPADPVSP